MLEMVLIPKCLRSPEIRAMGLRLISLMQGCQMCFVKILAIFPTVTDLGYSRKRRFNGTGFRLTFFIKNAILTMHFFFMLFSLGYIFMKLPE